MPFAIEAEAKISHAHNRSQIGITPPNNRIGGMGLQSELVAGPADLAERIAILENDGARRRDAEIQVLGEIGFTSWEAYAAALAANLKCNIEGAQVPSAGPLRRRWQALVRDSLSFLASPWWPLACRHGWSLIELFGVDSDAALVRVDGWGLAIAPALSSLPPTRLVDLNSEGAVFVTESGGRLSWPRFSGRQSEQSIPWWELPQ
jgi:hypothetical protein